MKRIILLLILFFSAVAISPMLVKEKGYILIAMDDLTIESTVVNAVIMLVLLFVALLMTLKVFKGSIQLGFRGWNKFAFASQRKALANYNKGVSAYILGDYQQAEHLLAKSAEPARLEKSAYLLAAAASGKQGLPENIKHYLTQFNNLADSNNAGSKNLGLEPVLIQLQLLLSQDDYSCKNLIQAREIIDLHHKEIGHDYRLLCLEIDLCLKEQRHQAVIDYLVLARKDKNITQTRIHQWEEQAFAEQFNHVITTKDIKALQSYWLNLPKKLRQQTSIVYAYCHVLSQHEITDSLHDIILPVLKKGSNTEFLLKVRALPVHNSNALVALVQHHLHKSPTSALWLSYLAHLAAGDKQWTMAEKAFNSLFHLSEPEFDAEDLRVFSSVLSQLNKHEKANEVLRKVFTLTV